MKIRWAGIDRRGRALDLRATDVDARSLVGWIRDAEDDRVRCPTGGPLHRQVGWIREGMSVDRRAALAAAARSIGVVPPQQPEIDSLTERIDSISPDVPDLEGARERVARASAALDGQRERVARLSGRLAERRDAGRDTTEAAAAVATAARRLSEVETEVVAAEQELRAVERRAREARDLQEKRLSLVDRRDNRRRDARKWLAEEIRPRVRRAIRSLPVDDPGEEDRSATDIRPVVFALGIVRVARIRAPVVLESGPFDRARRARAALAASVVLV